MSDQEKQAALADTSSASNGETPARVESPNPDPEKSTDSTEDDTPEYKREIHGVKWVLTVAAILSCVFLYALDTTVVADIQPNIIASLGDFQKFPWLATAYALPSTALVLIQSKMYGLFDIKWLYFAYVVLFEVGSAISGAAPTMDSLIVGRMIAGIGGCGIYVGSLTLFSVVTTPKERPLYISLISPTWGLGTVLGPIVSCFLLCHSSSVSFSLPRQSTHLYTCRLAVASRKAASVGDGASTSTC